MDGACGLTHTGISTWEMDTAGRDALETCQPEAEPHMGMTYKDLDCSKWAIIF